MKMSFNIWYAGDDKDPRWNDSYQITPTTGTGWLVSL